MIMKTFDPILTQTVEKIYWAGGEPINDGRALVHYDKLVEMGKTTKVPMRIFHNTNFRSILYKDQDAIDLWSKFDPRCISIGASLDASNERGEYILKELYGVKLLKIECVSKRRMSQI